MSGGPGSGGPGSGSPGAPGPSPPGYSLVDEEGHGLWCQAADVAGFFVETTSTEPAWRTFELVDCGPDDRLPRRCRHGRSALSLGNAELWVLGVTGTPIGSYSISSVVALECRATAGSRAAVNVVLEGLFPRQPNPHADLVWRRWRTGPPTGVNEWSRYAAPVREGWLEVVRMHHFSNGGRPVGRPPGTLFDMDGRFIVDPASFFCAMGEAINGPGGYFGADLDGLADCLRGGFGANAPFSLAWHNAGVAEASLGARPGPADPHRSYLQQILDVLDDARVAVTLR